mmetsp:Transcript_135447/g.289659  ORF Transcript_135447/g.289659 Transcript_135447/m.289659 type:complete len:208 (-) Transcript_135447:102-725(-)
MGAGAAASISQTPTPTCNGSPSSQGIHRIEEIGTATSVGAVEGGLQWLILAVDKEKKEKEWLARKFDEKCAEAQSLHKELEAMRLELRVTQQAPQRLGSKGERETLGIVGGSATGLAGLRVSTGAPSDPVTTSPPAGSAPQKKSARPAGLRVVTDPKAPAIPNPPADPVPQKAGLNIVASKIYNIHEETNEEGVGCSSPKRIRGSQW